MKKIIWTKETILDFLAVLAIALGSAHWNSVTGILLLIIGLFILGIKYFGRD